MTHVEGDDTITACEYFIPLNDSPRVPVADTRVLATQLYHEDGKCAIGSQGAGSSKGDGPPGQKPHGPKCFGCLKFGHVLAQCKRVPPPAQLQKNIAMAIKAAKASATAVTGRRATPTTTCGTCQGTSRSDC
jgi:hypothetical protein